jgi:alkylation response protein AidB-like acyl-CoA dehydrogenase
LDDGAKSLIRTLDQAAIALANEMMGGAQAMLDSAVDYAKVRVQFGRTIGSFQAIKHKCADMLLDVELAKSAAYCAAQAAAVDDPEWPALACLAKAATSETYLRTAAECIQIHGGIGFTWDNDTHLWFKRAKSSEVFLGQPSYHRELLMQRWGV